MSPRRTVLPLDERCCHLSVNDPLEIMNVPGWLATPPISITPLVVTVPPAIDNVALLALGPFMLMAAALLITPPVPILSVPPLTVVRAE